MRVLEKNGVKYPRTERCGYCRSLVELDKDDTTITSRDYFESGPWVMGNFRQEYHCWTCPICENDNEIEGENYEI
jgi:hypothetical protein